MSNFTDIEIVNQHVNLLRSACYAHHNGDLSFALQKLGELEKSILVTDTHSKPELLTIVEFCKTVCLRTSEKYSEAFAVAAMAGKHKCQTRKSKLHQQLMKVDSLINALNLTASIDKLNSIYNQLKTIDNQLNDRQFTAYLIYYKTLLNKKTGNFDEAFVQAQQLLNFAGVAYPIFSVDLFYYTFVECSIFSENHSHAEKYLKIWPQNADNFPLWRKYYVYLANIQYFIATNNNEELEKILISKNDTFQTNEKTLITAKALVFLNKMDECSLIINNIDPDINDMETVFQIFFLKGECEKSNFQKALKFFNEALRIAEKIKIRWNTDYYINICKEKIAELNF